MAVRIQLRRDTQANWESHNPILSSGEMGIETDTNEFKFGNGTDAWNDLSYVKTTIESTPSEPSEPIDQELINDVNEIKKVLSIESKGATFVTLHEGFATDHKTNHPTLVLNTTFPGFGSAEYILNTEVSKTVDIHTHWYSSDTQSILYAFIDEDNKYIKKVLVRDVGGKSNVHLDYNGENIEIPEGATRLFINCKISNNPSGYEEFNGVIPTCSSETITELIDIKDCLTTVYKAQYVTEADGFYHVNGTTNRVYLNTSNPVFAENYKGYVYDVSNILSVDITTHWKSSDNSCFVWFFTDELGNIIKSLSLGAAGAVANEQFTYSANVQVPAGSKYIYINSRKSGNLDASLDGVPATCTSDEVLKLYTMKDLDQRVKNLEGNSGSSEGTTSNGYSKKIKILFIGNSMTQDCTSYVPLILRNLAPELDFTIYNWYHASYTLAQHLADWKAGIGANILSLAQNTHTWSSVNKLMPDLLKEKFDIIVLQEYFNPNRMPTYDDAAFATYEEVVNYIQDNHTTPFELATLFHQPHRTDASNNMDEIYKTTYDGIIRQLRETPTLSVIPSGIAMYYACKDEELNALGSAGGLSPDGIHAQEGLPCMIQAYVTAQWILEKVAIGRSILNDSTRVTASNYPSINVPGANGSVVEGTDSQYRKAQRLAMKAIKIGKHMNNTAFSEIESEETESE